MPAVRVSRRRRSSLALSFQPAKGGIYGLSRPVTFAPNVTPVSYVAPDSSSSTPEPSSPTSTLFPPSSTPAPPPTRRRVPPGKRRSLGYIPRPPNAFMLFRADFVRQKHVPGSIETNHGSLSKIIGNCWRSLPLEEKRVWETKAKHAKADHKQRYPDYRFKPVHGKHKDKKKDKPLTTLDDERRCEEVAQLLLEGKKGDELAAAVRDLDLLRTDSPATNTAVPPVPVFHHRRSSSVPLPNDFYSHYTNNIMLPSAPFPFYNNNNNTADHHHHYTSLSRPASPISSIARQHHHQLQHSQHHQLQNRMLLGSRRASSAQPLLSLHRSWTLPMPTTTPLFPHLQRDDSPLPDVDTSLFEQSFLDPGASAFHAHDLVNQAFRFPVEQGRGLGLGHGHGHGEEMALGPLESVSPQEVIDAAQHQHHHQSQHHQHHHSLSSVSDLDPLGWLSLDHEDQSQNQTHTQNSHPSTAYSGSPAPSEPLSVSAPQLHAPQPQPAVGGVLAGDMWGEFGVESQEQDHSQLEHSQHDHTQHDHSQHEHSQHHQNQNQHQNQTQQFQDLNMGMGCGDLDLSMGMGMGLGMGMGMDSNMGLGLGMGMGMGMEYGVGPDGLFGLQYERGVGMGMGMGMGVGVGVGVEYH